MRTTRSAARDNSSLRNLARMCAHAYLSELWDKKAVSNFTLDRARYAPAHERNTESHTLSSPLQPRSWRHLDARRIGAPL